MTTTSIEALVERTMRDIELRGAGPLVFGYHQVENGVRRTITAQAKEIERLREGLVEIETFVACAFAGDTDAPIALDAISDVAQALLTKEPTP